MKRSTAETGFLGDSPRRSIRRVRAQEPLFWFYRGVGDLVKTPAVSLSFGLALYIVAQAGSYLLAQAPATTLAYSAVVVIAAFFAAAGLCAGSRHLERARPGSLASVFRTIWHRKTYLFLLALAVAALAMGWFRLASQVLIVDAATSGVAADALNLTAMTPGWAALGSLVLITAAITVLIVGSTSLALPLVIDGDNDFLKAMLTSCQVFARSPGAMFVWTLAVVATAAIGVFLSQLAMVFFITVICHAAWHGYRASIDAVTPEVYG